jgi:hypothetical protein
MTDNEKSTDELLAEIYEKQNKIIQEMLELNNSIRRFLRILPNCLPSIAKEMPQDT